MGRTVAAVVILSGLMAASARDDAKYVKLVNGEDGKVLAVKDNSEEAGAKVVLAKDDDSEAQQWKLEKDGDYYKIVHRKSGKVLDVERESTQEGGAIIIWDDKAENNDNQRWSWVGDGKKRRLKSKSSGLVLDVGDEKTVVQRSTADNAKEQLWEVVEVKAKPQP
jgi:hypothetical protein